jgi:hypothetical protein
MLRLDIRPLGDSALLILRNDSGPELGSRNSAGEQYIELPERTTFEFG